MNTENPYLNRSDVNIERLLKEKKWAKLVIFVAGIGVFAGLSAAPLFYLKYELIIISSLAFLSGINQT